MATSKPNPLTHAAPSSRRLGTFVLSGLILVLTACATTAEPDTTIPPEPEPALPDGQFFAFVTVGTDETDVTTLGVDRADLLSGEQARQKAIEDGVIEEGEDLPNDFYIDNDEIRMDLLRLAEEPEIMVISGNDTTKLLKVSEEQLWQLWNGDYVGEPVYGILASTPIAMDVTVVDGEIARMGAVYLP